MFVWERRRPYPAFYNLKPSTPLDTELDTQTPSARSPLLLDLTVTEYNELLRYKAKVHPSRKGATSGESRYRRYVTHIASRRLLTMPVLVEHKVRQFEAWLSDALENFRIYQEGQISRVPKLVRGLTMREFGDKYNGDVQAALRGVQRERMGISADAGAGDIEIDKSTRKRKWVASMEAEHQLAEGSKSVKNGKCFEEDRCISLISFSARMASMSPQKKPGSSTGPGTAQRARLAAASRTPGAVSERSYTEVRYLIQRSLAQWAVSHHLPLLSNLFAKAASSGLHHRRNHRPRPMESHCVRPARLRLPHSIQAFPKRLDFQS